MRTTGWLDLNDKNETLADTETTDALRMRAGSLVTTGAGSLILEGIYSLKLPLVLLFGPCDVCHNSRQSAIESDANVQLR